MLRVQNTKIVGRLVIDCNWDLGTLALSDEAGQVTVTLLLDQSNVENLEHFVERLSKNEPSNH